MKQKTPARGILSQHAPDLIRGLARSGVKVPARRPGGGLPAVHYVLAVLRHGAFCLHSGIASLWSDLHRTQQRFAAAACRASSWAITAYREISDIYAGLVRSTRKLRRQFAARTAPETLATCLEGSAYRRKQSALAGYFCAITGLEPPWIWRQGEDLFCARSRIRSGTCI